MIGGPKFVLLICLIRLRKIFLTLLTPQNLLAFHENNQSKISLGQNSNAKAINSPTMMQIIG